jgi:hypothetical protein
VLVGSFLLSKATVQQSQNLLRSFLHQLQCNLRRLLSQNSDCKFQQSMLFALRLLVNQRNVRDLLYHTLSNLGNSAKFLPRMAIAHRLRD